MQEFVIFKRCSKHCNIAENVASKVHFSAHSGEFVVQQRPAQKQKCRII
jgi:hypothetical protein